MRAAVGLFQLQGLLESGGVGARPRQLADTRPLRADLIPVCGRGTEDEQMKLDQIRLER